jgi:hypothetical protein
MAADRRMTGATPSKKLHSLIVTGPIFDAVTFSPVRDPIPPTAKADTWNNKDAPKSNLHCHPRYVYRRFGCGCLRAGARVTSFPVEEISDRETSLRLNQELL